MQGEGGGVVSLLETIMQDFSGLIMETQTAEELSSKEHKKFMEDSKIDSAEKESTISYNKEKIQEQTTLLEQRKTDLVSSQVELKAATTYYEGLHDQCLNANKAAEEARLQRQKEIASLEAARKALS
jgi:hypothetical protein